MRSKGSGAAIASAVTLLALAACTSADVEPGTVSAVTVDSTHVLVREPPTDGPAGQAEAEFTGQIRLSLATSCIYADDGTATFGLVTPKGTTYETARQILTFPDDTTTGLDTETSLAGGFVEHDSVIFADNTPCTDFTEYFFVSG